MRAVRGVVSLLRVVLAVAVGPVGCASDDLLAQLPDAGPPDAAPAPPDACVGGSHIVYLNRTATTLRPGADDSVANTIGILTSEQTSVAPNMTDTDWQAIMSCATAELAPFDIQVTDQDPGTTDHVEVVISQSAADLGLDPNYQGVAREPCPAGGPRDIALLFWGQFGPSHRRQACELILWDLGALAGNSYSTDCHDVMFRFRSDDLANGGCGPKSFVSTPAMCAAVTGAPAPCRCGGTTQSSFERMLDHYGISQCAP